MGDEVIVSASEKFKIIKLIINILEVIEFKKDDSCSTQKSLLN